MTIKQSGIFHHSHDDCILDLQLILKKKKNLKNHIYATFPLMLHITYSIFQPVTSRYPYSQMTTQTHM